MSFRTKKKPTEQKDKATKQGGQDERQRLINEIMAG
jgi:hypothetical protein